MVMLAHLHRDPSSAVLEVLKPLDAFTRDPDEECITVVRPGGDKGVDELFSICQVESWMEFCNIPEVVKGSLAQVFDVGLKCEVGVHFNAEVRQGDVLTGERDVGEGG